MTPRRSDAHEAEAGRGAISHVRLRDATVDDLEAIARIWHQGWHDGHVGHVPESVAAHRTSADFQKRSADRLGATRVAATPTAVLGMQMVVENEVEQLYVSRDARGTGAAASLLADAVARIASTYDTAWLAVVAGNGRARRFYERQGWREHSVIQYEAAGRDGKIVVPSLRYEKRL